MSWTIRFERKYDDEASGMSKYEVDGFRFQPSWSSVEPVDLEINRKAILSDFEKILPVMVSSSIRFRSQVKFAFQDEEPIDMLAGIGKKLYQALNSEIKEKLSGATSIHLVTNDLTVPWDILHDGEEFFQMRCPIGISPNVKRQDLLKDPKKNSKLNVLFVVDTKNNLPQTSEEIKKILSLMEKNIKTNKIEYVFLKGDDATRSHVSQLLQKQYFDVIHFATHSNFSPANPKETGIVLNDGILQARDIYKTIKDDPPWLVFMNACESAKNRDLSYFEKYDELSGLGIAFVKAGAPSYIGTKSLINDHSASELATVFYRNLLQGLTIGESLKKAKKEFFNNNPQDLSWSSFVLYGNPDLQKDLVEEENIICAHCHSTNFPASKYCSNCGLTLDNNKDRGRNVPVMQGAMKRDHKKTVSVLAEDLQTIKNNCKRYISAKEFKKELDYLELAVDKYPKDSELWNYMGVALIKLSRYEEAIICFEKSIVLNANNSLAWANKGVAFEKLSSYAEAMKNYDNALNIDPNYDDVWNLKGRILYSLERYQEAIYCFDRILVLNPNMKQVLINKSKALDKLGKHEEAQRCYKRAQNTRVDTKKELYDSNGKLVR